MKKMLLGLLCLAMASGVLYAGGGSEGGGSTTAKTFTGKISTSLTENDPFVQAMYGWANAVKEKSNGQMTMTVYPTSQMGIDEDVFEQAMSGVNVAVMGEAGRLANYVPEIGLISMPYLADNYDELMKIVYSVTMKGYYEKLSKEHGLRVISYAWLHGYRHMLTNKPVKVPGDAKGQRVRTIGAPIWVKTIESMGAIPTAMAWTEVYTGMQQKAIDGCEAQHLASYTSRLYEVIKYIDKTGHIMILNNFLVGEKWFSTLPGDLQKIATDECDAAGRKVAKEIVDSLEGEYEKKMVDAGMIVVDSDRAAFKSATQHLYKEFKFEELRDAIYREIGKN